MAYARAMVFRNPTVEIDEVAYASQVSKARLVPDTPTQTMRTFGGVDKDRDSTSWTLELAGHQDRGTGGLAVALDAAATAGDPIEIVIQAKAGTGQDVATFSIVPVPVEFGGESGNWKLFDATFEVIDQPVFSQSAA
ncbi:hypothetical protein [Paractinoplanes hotanensis]|uniref:Uncharacterized protein n=1 Tax=Paractinoplanes hotanensis TaxID=2906497 RepID=A0ABT0Y305_9ACTN|nr:hypothetical protein [Actinoplanes hotanensis]MCM4080410.1 hypothetical protein [Actinoplanes hotanensis]